MSQRVSTEIVDGIAYVTLTRPEKLNAVDFEMMDGLIEAAKKLERNRDVRAVILQGDGRAFSAGIDLNSLGSNPVRMVLKILPLPGRTANYFQQVCWVWRELPVPVIAVTHGRCYGAGIQLALAADFRFSTPDCEFSVMEARWGLIPDMTASVTLRELVGMDTAKRLAMTAELFDGERAAELGLVTGVSSEPLKDAEALAEELKTRSPDAVSYAKKLFNSTRHLSPSAAFAKEARLQMRLITGVNHRIARAAGKAKELPKWVARTVR